MSLLLHGLVGCSPAREPPKLNSRPPQQHVSAGRPTQKRSLSPEQLRQAMRARALDMAACYELSPAKEKQLAGDLMVDFTVEASGAVSAESLTEDSIGDKLLSDCVLEVVRKTTFPRAETALDVSWPMHFGAR